MTGEEKSVPVAIDSASESGQADVIVKAVPKKNWSSYIWDTFDKSPEERWFLFKLDAAVLTFASLGISILLL
jgi:ACS family pantothenate transporter-like MFS transporter